MRPERLDVSKKRKFDNLEGRQFGEITILYPIATPDHVGKANKNQYYWAQCSCGKEWAISSRTLKRSTGGRTGAKACAECSHKVGGAKRIQHGHSRDRIYKIWTSMKSRCSEKWATNTHGARGIYVCDKWNKDGEEGFLPFYEWSIANGYQENLTLERLDVDGPYSPENCTWATVAEQNRNKRNNLRIEVNGETVTLSQYYYSKPGRQIPYSVAAMRYRNGWTLEEIFSIPHGGKRKGGSIFPTKPKKEKVPLVRPKKMYLSERQRDWSGVQVGEVTVLYPIHTPDHVKSGSNRQYFWAMCSCGKEYAISHHTLKKNVLACRECSRLIVGARYHVPDRKRNKRLRKIWLDMKRRCREDGMLNYRDRGIRVCPVWYNDFYEFYTWATNNGYDHHLTLDRIDVNGNYCPENCRWTTVQEQGFNKTNTVYVEYKGETWSLAKLWRTLDNNLSYDTVYSRYNSGWDTERIFSTPYKPKNKG